MTIAVDVSGLRQEDSRACRRRWNGASRCAALAACGAGGSSEGSSSAGSSTSSPTPSVSLDARCQLGPCGPCFQPSQAIVSSRCQVAKSGNGLRSGIVRSGGQEQPFFAQNTGASWQHDLGTATLLGGCRTRWGHRLLQRGRPDDTKLVLPTTKPPKATASPTATAVPSNSASTQ